MTKITPEKFKLACIGSGGVRAVIAQSIGVERMAVTRYLEKHPEMQQYVDEADRALDDMAENKLAALIREGNVKAIQFRLQNKQKYVPKQTIEHTGEMTTTIKTVTPEELKAQMEKIRSKKKDAN